jgi:ribonuclease Z
MITTRILGGPKEDNAALLEINNGQRIDTLLFDCGYPCPSYLRFGTIQSIDAVFFSHFHMDHISGFDAYFRCNFGRTTKPNVIWGPPDTARVMHHRFQAYTWNLIEGLEATWWIHEIHENEIKRFRCEASEAFSILHTEASTPLENGIIVDTPLYTIEALTMDHRLDCMAYIVREKPKENVDVSQLKALGIKPGPWIRSLKENSFAADDTIEANGKTITLATLREQLLVTTPGASVAYLTDFLLDEHAFEKLVPALQGCTQVICESQYRKDDAELAKANYHMTSEQVGKLAAAANIQELLLFHLSERYGKDEWPELLQEVREHFPNAHFPASWDLPTA